MTRRDKRSNNARTRGNDPSRGDDRSRGDVRARSGQTRARNAAVRAPRLPGWVPIAVYAVLTVVLFREFFFGGVSLLGNDSLELSYFARDFYTEFVQAFHRIPYWDPMLFGGLPFVEGMHGDIFYPPSLAMFFMDARVMWGWKMSLHVFAAGVFTYLWLRRGLKLDSLPSFFGGLVYMLGAHVVSLVLPGGDGKLFVASLAPLLFWLTERAVSGRRASDFALFALGIALLLFTSHMQAAYFCVWGVSLYFVFRVWQVWKTERSGAVAAKLIGAFALAGLLGVGAAAVQFLPPLGYLREYSHRVDRAEQGERGYEWSSTYSLNAEEIASLAVPEFVGELPNAYWGKNPLKLNSEYAGLIPLLLIPVLLLRRRTAQTWFFVGLGALSLLFALASSTPLGRVFYLIPGVSLFRAWSIIIFLYGLSVATLGALAVQRMQEMLLSDSDADEAAARRVLWIAAGVFGALALLAASGVLLDAWTAVFHRNMGEVQRAALDASRQYITNGFWIAFGLAIATAALWHAASRKYLSVTAFVVLLATLVAVDLIRADRPFVRTTVALNENAAGSSLFTPDETILELQRLRDAGGVFRVHDMSTLLRVPRAFGANDFAVHGIEQLAGHHGNEMGRYRNLIGGEHAENVLLSDLRLVERTNTEYLVIPARIQDPRLEEVHVGSRAAIYRYRDALPRAWLVGETEIVPGDTAAIQRYLAADFDPRTIAILPEPLPADMEPEQGATGLVEWMNRGTDAYSMRVTADRPALLVVLDTWYPAWRAYVNGSQVPVFRANHAFRAVPVPAGEHVVEFRFVPSALRQGAMISIVVLTFLLLVVVSQPLRDRRRKDRTDDALQPV